MGSMSTKVNRGASVTMFVAVLVGFSGLGYGVAKAAEGMAADEPAQVVDTQPVVRPAPSQAVQPRKDARKETRKEGRKEPRTERTRPAEPRKTPVTKPAAGTAPEREAKPEPPAPPKAGPRLFGPGDKGPQVRELQARLRQIAWFSGDVTDFYGDQTTEAVRGFQAKRGIAVTGYVDQETLDRLHGMTREPSSAELQNKLTPMGNVAGALDPRCSTGRALCIDKSSRTLRWVVGGKVQRTVDVRFGAEYTPTREGAFKVGWKSRDHVSSLYHTSMPFAMFFSGGQAVHYSPDFAATGYNGASHGCVNVRDRAAIEWLFDQVRVGDKVIVYWS